MGKTPLPGADRTDPAVQKVERRTILRRVFGEQAPSVVVLQAPAGHGKTMVLGQIRAACESRRTHCAWLTLDQADNDSRRHANHLRTAIAALSGPGARGAKPAPPPHAQRKPPQRADWLIDALSAAGHDIALFVDEFEVLTDRAVLTFWKDFLFRCPASVRVFIASRAIPELGLARLLVSNRLLLLSAEDLRFSRDEVQTFFSLHRDLVLHPAEIDTIHRRSEGWPAAVQLFRLGLSHPETRRLLADLDHDRPRELAEYLTECVLDGQTAEVRDFLLRTCLLNRLTAPLCEQLTGRDGAQQMLLKLEREGLFVRALDADRVWFRYHPLFASQLAEQMRATSPRKLRQLHQQAARWLWASGHCDDALHHAVAARDFDLASAVLKQWSSRLVASGEMATVGRWLDLLPATAMADDAELLVRMAWALIFLQRPGRLAEALQALDRRRSRLRAGDVDPTGIMRAVAAMCADRIPEAAEAIAAVPPLEGATEGFEAFEQAAAENLRAYLHTFRGDLAAAHLHLARARSFNHFGDAAFSGAYTASFESIVLLLEGRVGTALDCLRAGLAHQRTVLDPTFVSSALASCYLWALYEVDDLDLLEAVAEEYGDLLADTATPDLFAVGQICLARTHLLRRRESESLLVLERAQYHAARNGWRRLVAAFDLEKRALPLRTAAAARHRPPAGVDPDLIARASVHPGWQSPTDELLRSTRFLLARSAPATDDAWASHPYGQLRACVERALFARDAGRNAVSQRFMRQALSLSASTGLVRPLLDYGAMVMPLLDVLADADAADSEPAALAYRLLRAHTAGTSVSAGINDVQVPVLSAAAFTEREREILGFLSRRLSNKEIARRTLLSENTVKFHLKNIFAKLGVARRLDAFAAILRLNLVEP